jgi:hypothetical protein
MVLLGDGAEVYLLFAENNVRSLTASDHFFYYAGQERIFFSFAPY